MKIRDRIRDRMVLRQKENDLNTLKNQCLSHSFKSE